jgi:hypothetical protein
MGAAAGFRVFWARAKKEQKRTVGGFYLSLTGLLRAVRLAHVLMALTQYGAENAPGGAPQAGNAQGGGPARARRKRANSSPGIGSKQKELER